jgi:hypothetical protein
MKELPRQLLQGLALIVLFSLSNQGLIAQENGDLYRWDIVTLRTVVGVGDVGGTVAGDVIISPGGTVVAGAPDNTSLTLTGSGLFQVDQTPRIEEPRIGQTASGGGTWVVRSTPLINFPFEGGILGSGTYTATELIHFQPAAGRVASNVFDSVGAAADLRAGLMMVKLRFSDGSHGMLMLQTNLVGTSPATPRLVRVIKGSVEYSASETATIHVQR